MKVKLGPVKLFTMTTVLILTIYLSYEYVVVRPNSPFRGFYEGEEILFVATEVSDGRQDVLGRMMRPSVIISPSLKQVPASSRAQIFVFVNGTIGGGPFGYQHNVLERMPSDGQSDLLMNVNVVSWRRATNEGSEIEQKVIPRELKSVREIALAQGYGEITIIDSGIVVSISIMKG